MEISIVSPVYNAGLFIDALKERLVESLKKMAVSFEIVLVDDGSSDDSWEKITKICAAEKNIKGIKLSRNFGQHNAVTAGLNEASGNYIVIIDCDLQNDPGDISQLYQTILSGYDIVFTKRKSRSHSLVKSFNAWLYNRVFRLFSDANFSIDLGSMVIFSNKVKSEFLKIKDKDRLYLQLLKWLGFTSTTVEVEHHKRYAGTSGYTFLKLLNIGLQGWTSHSKKLLMFTIYGGLLLSFLSFCVGISIFIRYFFHSFQPGWPSIFVAITFSTGIIMLSIGILGIYIGKIFEQVKDRPLYIIDEKLN